jgi:hypothetical protein
MRRILLVAGGSFLLGGCNNTPRFDAVTIRPIYGWTDGCGTARISGHGMSDDATVKIGANTMGPPELAPTIPDYDKGYWFERQIPAGTKGFADVVVINGDGKTATIPKAFYYVECPGVAVDALADEADGVLAAGDTVTVRGCGLTTDLRVKIGDADPVALTQTCGAGIATFQAPANPAGDYLVTFVDASGNLVYPPVCDTADTGAACAQFPVTYGGS